MPTATPAPTGTPQPRGGDEPTPTPVVTPTPVPTATPVAATFAAATPQITPPSTDTAGSSNGAAGSGWGLVLIVLGAISLSGVLLTPATRRVRR